MSTSEDTESMVERVARALAEAWGYQRLHPDDARILARVAISAMRTPTPLMLDNCLRGGTIIENWQAMIDQALRE